LQAYGMGIRWGLQVNLERSASVGTILVVDDEVLIRMMVVDELLDQSFTCEEASSAAEALSVLERNPDIGLMITDIGLPGGLDGNELAQRARQLRPGLKIMLMTGYTDAKAPAEGMEVLTKPFDMGDLVRKVDGLLAGAAS
jgi:DNA-binding response OmpR family regulator